MPPALVATLESVARTMVGAHEPWWVIGSTAVALHGGATTVADVDLLVSEGDMAGVLERCGLSLLGLPPDGRFRSRLFARWPEPPVTVEVMAGFQVACEGEWTPVSPQSRLAVAVGDATVFVPSCSELIQLLARFGRPKDHARIAALRGVPDQAQPSST